MKQLLLILSLFTVGVVKGQTKGVLAKDTTHNQTGFVEINYSCDKCRDSLKGQGWTKWTTYKVDSTPIPLYDTMPVVMLVCDTSSFKETESWTYKNYNDSFKEISHVVGHLPEVGWEFGYAVRKKHNEAEGILDPGFCYGCVYEDYYVEKYYLNSKKQPLNKNIIVWMSKSIKQ